jgi:hypothetical protein
MVQSGKRCRGSRGMGAFLRIGAMAKLARFMDRFFVLIRHANQFAPV